MLPDPHDYSWEECRKVYQDLRASALVEIRKVRKITRILSGEMEYLEKTKALSIEKIVTFKYRAMIVGMNHTMPVEDLVMLRRWFELVRVVHGKTDANEYQIRQIALRFGIPAEHIRKTIGMVQSLFATKH